MKNLLEKFLGLSLFAALATMVLPSVRAQQSFKPHKVTIAEDKPAEDKSEEAERVVLADQVVRVEYAYQGNMIFGVSAEGKRLANSVHTRFMIDDKVEQPMAGPLQNLPDLPGRKNRKGGQTQWQQGDVRVTMVIEVVPGKPSQTKPGTSMKRRLDTLLIKYSIENTGAVPHKVGCRVFIDTQVVGNDGALFASSKTHPGKILNGLVLEGNKLPEFLEVLEKPDLQDPGFKGIFTLKPGNKLEGPGKVVLTTWGSQGAEWDVPANMAGDSACGLFWQPKELQPRSKRELAYAYGQGVASTFSDGRAFVNFGGSFEPGKRFTITASVGDPEVGQSLSLLLPRGLELIEGKATQVVPPTDENGNSVIMWRCQLLEVGAHTIQVRSSTGATRSWTVKVAPPD